MWRVGGAPRFPTSCSCSCSSSIDDISYGEPHHSSPSTFLLALPSTNASVADVTDKCINADAESEEYKKCTDEDDEWEKEVERASDDEDEEEKEEACDGASPSTHATNAFSSLSTASRVNNGTSGTR